MMVRFCLALSAVLTLVATSSRCARAEIISFGSGSNQFGMEFVAIGDPGNAADVTGTPNPVGSVSYRYSIGVYEVRRSMVTKANSAASLGIKMGPMDFVTGGARENMPATGVGWYGAAKFVNYLNVSQGFSEAYKFDVNGDFQLWQNGDAGFDPLNAFRNSLAVYALPNTDEWYKSAFYDGNGGYFDYATGSNTPPIAVTDGTAAGTAVYNQTFIQGPADVDMAGGLSPMGTVGQNGNAVEWEESEFDQVNNSVSASRGYRGAAWNDGAPVLASVSRGGVAPHIGGDAGGFRVVRLTAVPEPGAASIILAMMLGSSFIRRRRS